MNKLLVNFTKSYNLVSSSNLRLNIDGLALIHAFVTSQRSKYIFSQSSATKVHIFTTIQLAKCKFLHNSAKVKKKKKE